jgi:hypothetical protein
MTTRSMPEDFTPLAITFSGAPDSAAETTLKPVFKTGQILDVRREGLDVYNTMLDVMGCKERLGPAGRQHQAVDAIRA